MGEGSGEGLLEGLGDGSGLTMGLDEGVGLGLTSGGHARAADPAMTAANVTIPAPMVRRFMTSPARLCDERHNPNAYGKVSLT